MGVGRGATGTAAAASLELKLPRFRGAFKLDFQHFSSAWPSGDNPEDILVGDEA